MPEELIESRYAASSTPRSSPTRPCNDPPGLGTLWRMDFTRDRRLTSLTTPTLVVWGATTRSTAHAAQQCWPSACPTADVYLAAKTGHSVQWERADLFNAVTTGFLNT